MCDIPDDQQAWPVRPKPLDPMLLLAIAAAGGVAAILMGRFLEWVLA